jgi:hypothetical protein
MENKQLKTGQAWATLLGVNVITPTGWNSAEDYNTLYLTKAEFCNRAAASDLEKKTSPSRRDAAIYAGRVKGDRR